MQRDSPRVSVTMPAYNAEPFIAEAIESVLAQTWVDWELIIIDDGSTDATGTVAQSFRDPRIRITTQPNGGEAVARNAALGQAHGEVIAFLDADDVWLPTHLDIACSHFDTHQAHAGLYTDGWYIDTGGRRLKSLSARRRGPFTGNVHAEAVRGSDLFGPPSSVVLRRSHLVNAQLRFSEDIGLVGTDWDFLTRFSERGEFGYVAERTCLYRVHTDNLSSRVEKEGRRLGLANCRMAAIRRQSFSGCPLDVRSNVFYDLLVNLLRPEPARQAEVVGWPQFGALPREERARLCRLMASKAILYGGDAITIRRWLDLSLTLNPRSARGRAVRLLYAVSPALVRAVLSVRSKGESDPLTAEWLTDIAVGSDT